MKFEQKEELAIITCQFSVSVNWQKEVILYLRLKKSI